MKKQCRLENLQEVFELRKKFLEEWDMNSLTKSNKIIEIIDPNCSEIGDLFDLAIKNNKNLDDVVKALKIMDYEVL